MSKYKGLFTFDVENHRYLPVEQADGLITEMDYRPEPEPKEPLIKDEKIRRTVRGLGYEKIVFKQLGVTWKAYDAELAGGFELIIKSKPFDACEDDGIYTIAELCGEEEE